jgi:hypothetical protein
LGAIARRVGLLIDLEIHAPCPCFCCSTRAS